MNTKIIVNTKNLVAALEQVEKIINTKSSDYLLRSAFIQAEDGKMKISANNLEVIGCKTINCITDDKIMFALEDVKRVIKALKYFKGCDTIITFDSDKACNFEDGKKSFKAGITDVNDNDAHSLFAHLGKVWIDDINSNNSNILEQHTYTIEKLMERYNSISYAIYTIDDLKPILKGINFKENKMVALDGYRLAVSTDTEDNGLSFENEFTINNNTFSILKQFKKGECNIISFKDITAFNLVSEDFTLLSRNLKGQYFKWKTAIPCSFSSEFEFEKKNMLENLKYLKEIRVKKTMETMDMFVIKNNELVSPYGSVDIEGLNISETSGYDLTRFTDAVKNLEGDRIKMLHSGALKPIVLKNVVENKYNSQLMLLCPIRLNDGMSTWWK